MTLCKTTFTIMTLSITILSIVTLINKISTLSLTMLSIMQSINVMLSVIFVEHHIKAFMLSVVMLSVIGPSQLNPNLPTD
jgi:hypothetical protein